MKKLKEIYIVLERKNKLFMIDWNNHDKCGLFIANPNKAKKFKSKLEAKDYIKESTLTYSIVQVYI
jgi:hypothetical protein